MRRGSGSGLALILGLIAGASAGEAKPNPPRFESITLTGKVVPLAEVLKETGLLSDPEATSGQVVLKGDDGTITPLLSDDASRALFKDERLRHRKAEIQGRRFAKVPYLQVVTFKVEEDGRLRTPEYFCEVCTISVRFPQICPCCQGEMVLRMKPDSP